MGKASGGTRTASNTAKNAPRIGVTEKGMDAALAKQVLSIEESIRHEREENTYVIDPKTGTIRDHRIGDENKTSMGMAYVGDIVTHNHPDDFLSGHYGIGRSFSNKDVENAVKAHLSEIRAVTPNYTFSLKLSKDGWGIKVDSKQIGKDYLKIYNRLNKEYESYLSMKEKAGAREGLIGEARKVVVLQHKTVKELAKKYGFEYTTKKDS